MDEETNSQTGARTTVSDTHTEQDPNDTHGVPTYPLNRLHHAELRYAPHDPNIGGTRYCPAQLRWP
jgi:hypothetical protein